jgi:glucose uptake protein GlcU
MKKYVFLFFVFTVLIVIIASNLLLIIGLSEEKASEYHIGLIFVAIASIITGCFFVKYNERAPTQKEGMTYLVSIMTILIIALIAFIVYIFKPFIDSGEVLLTRELITAIGYFVGILIEYILAIYLPFYFTCKLLARKYK